MTKDFTEPQRIALEVIAHKDEWELDVLERLVRQKMHEGFSFKYSVMHTLAHAKRPLDDNDPKVLKAKELANRVVELRDKMLRDYEKYQQEKKPR
jgi:hypothetical protein